MDRLIQLKDTLEGRVVEVRSRTTHSVGVVQYVAEVGSGEFFLLVALPTCMVYVKDKDCFATQRKADLKYLISFYPLVMGPDSKKYRVRDVEQTNKTLRLEVEDAVVGEDGQKNIRVFWLQEVRFLPPTLSLALELENPTLQT